MFPRGAYKTIIKIFQSSDVYQASARYPNGLIEVYSTWSCFFIIVPFPYTFSRLILIKENKWDSYSHFHFVLQCSLCRRSSSSKTFCVIPDLRLLWQWRTDYWVIWIGYELSKILAHSCSYNCKYKRCINNFYSQSLISLTIILIIIRILFHNCIRTQPQMYIIR